MTRSQSLKGSPFLDFKLRIKLTWKPLLFVLFFVSLAGCSSFSTAEQPSKRVSFQLSEIQPLGQTFLSRYDGLNGITVLIDSAGAQEIDLHLELFENVGDIQPIRTSDLQLAGKPGAEFQTFSFPPINQSSNEDYYLRISLKGPGNAQLEGGAGNTYLDGSLYVGDVPQNSQLAFNLENSPLLLISGLVNEFLCWLGILAVGIFLIAIPGWALLCWTLPPWRTMNWVTKLTLSLAAGIAIYPLLFLWAGFVSINLARWFALALPIIGLGLIILKRFRPSKNKITDEKVESSVSQAPDSMTISSSKSGDRKSFILNILPDIGFIVVAALIIFTRLWPIRSLDAAMWGDSYQHTLITQLFIENGGLFQSWLPYTDLSSFTYHFGFHSMSAVYHWLTGLNATQAVLWTGQMVNIFAVLTLYPLAVFIGKNRWAGVFAVLVAGLLSPVPMDYTNWGRFTQLSGQVILPASMVIIWMSLNSKRINWIWSSLIWIILAGLALSHYRVILFIPFFYVSYLVFYFRKTGFTNFLTQAFVQASGAILLILPWLVRLFDGKLPQIYADQIQVPAGQVSQAIQDYNAIGNIAGYLPLYLWILMIISILWGVIQRNRENNVISLWWVLILLAANPGWLNLPGTGIMSNFAVFITAYIPAGLLIGSTAGHLLDDFGLKKENLDRWHAPSKTDFGNKSRYVFFTYLALALVVVASLIGLRGEIAQVKPFSHSLVTRPDVRAGEWITENLPEDAKFLVNSFFAYGGSYVVGSDAGWWLPLLANRATTLPPLNYGTESSYDPNFHQETNDLVALIQEKGIDHPDSLSELYERGVTHLYIGQQRGKVNAKEPPILIPKQLGNDPNFKLVYDQDRIQIYELLRPGG